MGPLAPLLRLMTAGGWGEWTYPPKRACGDFFRRRIGRRFSIECAEIFRFQAADRASEAGGYPSVGGRLYAFGRF